jgi:hypothetical protein
MPFPIPEELFPVTTLAPAADAAGRTGLYVNLKNALICWVRFKINQGNAATVACSVNQGIGVAGASAKAIPAVPIWTNLDGAAASAFTRQTDAASYTTDAGLKVKYVWFQIDPAKLDTANGYNSIAAVTGASNAANITDADVYISARFPQSSGLNAQAN